MLSLLHVTQNFPKEQLAAERLHPSSLCSSISKRTGKSSLSLRTHMLLAELLKDGTDHNGAHYLTKQYRATVQNYALGVVLSSWQCAILE